jgi:hypothetical protein
MFKHAVHPAQLLLCAQLLAEIRQAAAAFLPVLARRIRPPLKGTLLPVAAVSFQKQFEILSSTQPT